MTATASPVELARRLFAEFQRVYAENLSRGSIWYLPIQGNEAHFGFSAEEARTAISVLTQKDLIEMRGIGRYRLTEPGREACLHPELIEARLGAPRPMSPVVHSSTVHVHGGNNQIGDGNTQNITYRSVLQAALEAAEERDDVPAAVAAAIKRLQDFPHIEALMSEAAERVARK